MKMADIENNKTGIKLILGPFQRLLIFIVFCCTVLFADFSSGSDMIFPFEWLGSGTRASAMAGACAGLADDANAVSINPAGLSLIGRGELFLQNTFLPLKNSYYQNFNSFLYAQPIKHYGSLGISLRRSFESGSRPVVMKDGLLLDGVNNILDVAYGRRIAEIFSAGLTVRLVNQNPDNASSLLQPDMDVGIMFDPTTEYKKELQRLIVKTKKLINENSKPALQAGISFFKAKRYLEAINSFQAVLRYDPNSSVARKQMEQCGTLTGVQVSLLEKVDMKSHPRLSGAVSKEERAKESERLYGKGLEYFYNEKYIYALKSWQDALDVLVLNYTVDRMRMGASVQNILKPEFYSSGKKFTTLMKMSLGFRYRIVNDSSLLVELARFEGPTENVRLKYGAEIFPVSFMCVRGGYQILNLKDSFSAGLGFKLKNFVLDYSFEPENVLAQHSFSLSFKLGLSTEDLAMQSLNQGIVFAKNGDYTSAKNEWKKALLYDPGLVIARKYLKGEIQVLTDVEQNGSPENTDNSEIYIQKGKELLSQKEYNQAKLYFDEARIVKSDDADLSDLIRQMEEEKLKAIDENIKNGDTRYAALDYAGALAEYEKGLQLDKNRKDIKAKADSCRDKLKDLSNNWKSSGADLFKKGSYQESKQQFEKILAIFPADQDSLSTVRQCDEKLQMVFVQTQAEAFYKSGLDSYAANDYSNAVEQWRKAQDLFPHYKNTDVMIVEANRKAAGEQERRQSLSRKKEDQIRKSKALAREAALLVEKKSYKEAIARMDLAADLDPDNPEIQKKRQDIRDQFNSLVEQLYEDGVASYNQEKLSIAIIKWNEVLKLAPDHQLALNFLAKANEQKQKSIELHLASGQQYFQNKEYAKALSEFREAGALAPENKDIRTKETLARERLKNDIERSFKEGQDSYSKGELEKAVEAFNQALTLDPEYIAASDYIKKCRTQLNQKEQEISIQTHLEKGKEYLKNRFFNNAIEEFNAVLAISAGHKDAQRLKMETEKMISENDSKSQVSKMFLEAAKHFRNEEYGEALDVLNKMKVLDPGNALVERYIMVVSSRWNTRCEKYYKKAVKSEEDGNFPEARDYYGKTMKLNTNYLDVKEKVKTFDVRAKDFLAATEKKALSFYADGNYIESYLLWSQILKISPDNKRALEYSRNASARSAEYKEAEKLKNSGISNFKNNHPEEALSDLVQAIELNKGLSESIKAATEELRKQLLPKSQNLFENADTSYNKGEYPAALHSISAFLYLIPNNQSALDLRQNIKKGMEKAAGEHYAKAQAALNRKDYSGGLKELEIVIQLSPNNQDARNLYNKIDNEYAGLRTDQERKKKVNIDTLLFEGIRFYREGDLKKAIGKWQEVLAVDSGNAKALDYINRARTKLNKIGS